MPWMHFPTHTGSVRRERLDHIVIVSEAHLHRVLKEYRAYFNRVRPHQGFYQRVPEQLDIVEPAAREAGQIIAFPSSAAFIMTTGGQPERGRENRLASG